MSDATQDKADALLSDPILRSLVKIAWPVILSNLLQSAYIMVDAFWVGHLGQNAVAAVSVSQPVNFLAFSLGSGLSVAGSILIAQYIGAKQREHASQIAGQVFLVAILLAIPVMLLGEFFAAPLLHELNVSSAVFSDALSFLRITLGGLIFTFGFFMLQSMLRGAGQVKIPMMITLMTVILNALLDPLLIFGWGPVPALGIEGAGLATLLTQAIAMFVLLKLMSGRDLGIQIRLQHIRPNPKVILRTIRLGFPSSIELSARAIGANTMVFLVTAFGTVATASYGVVNNINLLVIIPALGLSMATTTLVGQNIGANELKRARSIGFLSAFIAFIAMSVVGLVVFLGAPWIINFFAPDQTQVINEGTRFLHLIAPSYGLIGLQMALSGAFRATGKTVTTMIFALVSQWLIQIPLAWVLARHTMLGIDGLWWAFPLTNIIMAVITLLWYFTINWNKARLIR